MSARSLPIFFFNMGGEMMYILEQRLSAQNVPAIKAQKVLNDIISTMINKDFVKELFRPQDLYSKGALKSTFDKLAHASIMKLNASSVDKLYDLMSMAFKYQLYLCPRPSDLLFITLNHTDALKRMVGDQQIKEEIDHLNQLLIKTFMGFSEGEFQQIRHNLLNFFQDTHIRVSMFLRDNSQNPNGRFAILGIGQVPVDTEIPGSIRLFNSDGEIFRIRHFQNGGQYQPAPKSTTVTLNGDRGTTLGTNMYTSAKTEDNYSTSITHRSSSVVLPDNHTPTTATVSAAAMEELNFLAQLIGNCELSKQNHEFRLQLFDIKSNNESSNSEITDVNNSLMMVSPKQDNDELSKIMEDLKIPVVSKDSNNDNLLDLMDSTGSSQ
ncbi:Protein oscp1 [Chamberlinius hualienensis]